MVLSASLSRSDILNLIWETVPAGSPDPTDPAVLSRLRELTNQLIDASGRKRLTVDPFAEVANRQIALDQAKIQSILTNKVVLVTGGQGFVGTNLIAKLQQFGVKKIVSVDITSDSSQQVAIDTTDSNYDIPVTYYQGDVRDMRSIQDIFNLEHPQVVFHLAAQRLPGLAETQIHQTVSTNILGCDNIIRLCEDNQVEACIFSSTGKASRYFTPDIYAVSKKIAEWMFSDNSQPRNCQYGIVRFTHVLENSPVSSDLDNRVATGVVSLHAPDRYIYSQNIEESVSLLLNALTILEPGQTKLLAVKDIGWPINTLDLALHKILLADRDIPLYFKGLPAGYERHVFMGQLDLSGKREILPMLNVLEAEYSEISATGDTVIAEITPFDPQVVNRCIANIKQAVLETDVAIKETVIDSVKEIALSAFFLADPFKLLDILGWGINSKEMSDAGVDISYYQDTVALLVRGVGIPKTQNVATDSNPASIVEIVVEREVIDIQQVRRGKRTKQHQRRLIAISN